LQIELLRLRRRLDRAARDLGLLVHRRERQIAESRRGTGVTSSRQTPAEAADRAEAPGGV
jgi:hypothetical protein